ncbi:MAG: cache domain-containing protein [Methylacidiphilales bacterium]|nr:cache domain-containing protein [Candidatus Methylacidiphilales bacterium]
MKIYNRVALYTGLLVAIMSACVIAAAYHEISRTFYDHIQQQQEISMRVAQEQLERLGKPLHIADGKLMAGNRVLNGDQVVVDRVTSLVGGIATIFQGDTRIATNIRLPDGSRAVGTKLTGPAREAIFDRGENFRGEANTLGEPYLTNYTLLRDEQGTLVGMLQVGVLKKAYSGALNTILVRSFIIAFIGMLLIGFLVHEALSKLVRELQTVAEGRKVLLRSTFSGVFGVDVAGRCSFINHVGAKFLGGAQEDFIGKEIHSLIHHNAWDGLQIDASHCPLCQVFQSGNTYHNEDDVLWRLDKTSFSAEIQSFPLIKENKISGAIVAFSDITDRKQIARDIEAKNEEQRARKLRLRLQPFRAVAATALRRVIPSA